MIRFYSSLYPYDGKTQFLWFPTYFLLTEVLVALSLHCFARAASSCCEWGLVSIMTRQGLVPLLCSKLSDAWASGKWDLPESPGRRSQRVRHTGPQPSWGAPLGAQKVKNLPAVQKTGVLLEWVAIAFSEGQSNVAHITKKA